jgi:hypothetical protein
LPKKQTTFFLSLSFFLSFFFLSFFVSFSTLQNTDHFTKTWILIPHSWTLPIVLLKLNNFMKIPMPTSKWDNTNVWNKVHFWVVKWIPFSCCLAVLLKNYKKVGFH